MKRFPIILSSFLLYGFLTVLVMTHLFPTVRAFENKSALPQPTHYSASSSLVAQSTYTLHLPVILQPPQVEPLPPPLPFSATPPINFEAADVTLREQGLSLAYNKIGFHTGMGGNTEGLDAWMTELDSAGVPIFLKSADNAEPLYKAQQLMQESGVPHVLVFRRTGNQYDVPDYNLPPDESARQHWQRHKATWPPELDPSLVWIETLNEVDKNRSEWLAEFATTTAQLALADGYKWAAFGWSSGEPEPEHWDSPKMLDFLRLVSRYPDRLAIALHEYSYETDNIGRWYPYLTGRFQSLFEVCDRNHIKRPTVLITEWGWEYRHVPEPSVAMADIQWAAWLYAAYPQVKGAAIWYLGGYFGDVDDETQRLISPVREYSLSHYFGYKPGQGGIDPDLFSP